MKAVKLLINSILPPDLRNYDQTYDSKSINKIMHAVATKHPDKFAEIEKKIGDIGRRASYNQGETITLKDLASPIDKAPIYAQMDAELANLPPGEEGKKKKLEIFQKYNTLIEKASGEAALKQRNNIAMAVLSGARGKSAQLKAMIATPGTYSDYKGRVIPVFSRESFAEGIRPVTFLAGSFGTRSSTVSTKCLDKDTLVRMGDLSVKKISDIKVGDYVLGSDRQGHTFPVKVLNVFDQGEQDCYVYKFRFSSCRSDSSEVVCTENHKFLCETCDVYNKKRAAYARGAGDKPTIDDHHTLAVVPAKHMSNRKEPAGQRHCYDIEVDHPDHLFVLANGLITSNSATAKGGDLSKQFAATSADIVIRREDCGTENGISLEADDPSLRGRQLVHDVAGVKAGTFIDRAVLDKIRKSGAKHVVVRSPLTCNVSNGLCAHCVGKFYNGGKLPKVGDAVGLLASSTVGEPLTQMALCLHEDTLVKLPEGQEKPIKDIVPGDYVMGSDRQGVLFSVKVLNKFNQGLQECYRFDFSNGPVLCTKNHKILVDGKLIPAGDIPVSREYMGNLQCYDIEIAHPDHLFSLANGLVVSNSAKHTAGMTQSKKSYSGLPTIIQFAQSPEAFKDRGAVAEQDGRVDRIEEAPQGGTYITINGEQHYVLPGHEVMVKEGDRVEAGDQIAEGLVDPEDVVRLKGLGQGKLYYAERLNQMLKDSGAGTDKRNTEILARGAIRHIKITDPDGMGSYLPDDVVDYNAAQRSYRVPETAKETNVKEAVGKYLQQPYMHYTIGTRVTPSVAANLAENDYSNVLVDDRAPGFEAQLVRLRAASHTNPDWLASMATSYISKQLNESATRGDDTNVVANPDFRPRLAIGENFGKNVNEQGLF